MAESKTAILSLRDTYVINTARRHNRKSLNSLLHMWGTIKLGVVQAKAKACHKTISDGRLNRSDAFLLYNIPHLPSITVSETTISTVMYRHQKRQ